MVINFELNKFREMGFSNVQDMNDVIKILRDSVDYLKHHNKNLTRRQEYAVYDIDSILDCVVFHDTDNTVYEEYHHVKEEGEHD